MRYNFNLIDIQTKYEKYTSLIISIKTNSHEVFEYLIERGCNYDDYSLNDIFNNNIGHYLAINGYFTEIVSKINFAKLKNVENVFGVIPRDYLLNKMCKYIEDIDNSIKDIDNFMGNTKKCKMLFDKLNNNVNRKSINFDEIFKWDRFMKYNLNSVDIDRIKI